MLVRLVEDYGKRIKVFKEFVDTPKEAKPHPKVIWHWSNGRGELAEKGYWDYITKSVRIIQVRDATIAEYLDELLESNGNRSFVVIFGTLHKNIANYLKDIRNIEVKIIIRNKDVLVSNASNRLLARLLERGDFSNYDFRSDPDFNFLFEEYVRQQEIEN